MKKFTVLRDFTDLKDKNKVYRKGDIYPSPANKKVDEKRIKELSSTKNKLGKKVIEEIKEEQE
ncbi:MULTISPECIES: hypothetical protein [unclassified Sporosarcina]|uniref:hypothetical protein n=1 Tax=unclassified Sporosarcina TaxID=2647733 RepID=UPI00203D9A0E|nr:MULTISPECIES: hypothetical protein [unclassified Sporosarcina]GKV67300.1 hypothetical protein NCCP2331_34530 [Sporosarcina sp. NCCP-2331]GLB57639.1 hypothetical protein NCCP2378_34290 [Sporosarcina sp. NCCP-2378]